MKRLKKVGTRPAQGLNIVLGERTEQNGTERFKKSRNTPSPTKESNGRTKFMDEAKKNRMYRGDAKHGWNFKELLYNLSMV